LAVGSIPTASRENLKNKIISCFKQYFIQALFKV
jgi:hypothetical protein